MCSCFEIFEITHCPHYMYTASNPLHCPRAAKPLPRPALLQPLRSTRHQHAAPPNLMRARPSTAPTLTHSLRACSPSGRTTSTQRISNVQYAQTNPRTRRTRIHTGWLAAQPAHALLLACRARPLTMHSVGRWALAMRIEGSFTPISAAAERVFSLRKLMFAATSR